MDDVAATLESLIDVFLRQEVGLAELVGLALEEQAALIASDYPAIERISAAMMDAAARLDLLDRDRQALADRIGAAASLTDAAGAADAASVARFEHVRSRLCDRAGELRTVQEANARLILGAVKVRERWYSMLAGLGSPTYGAAGRQALHPTRGIVSRSA